MSNPIFQIENGVLIKCNASYGEQVVIPNGVISIGEEAFTYFAKGY